MSGRRRTLGLILGVAGIGFLLASIVPMSFLFTVICIVLVGVGWLFFKNG